MRQPNDLLISVELMEQLLSKGGTRIFSVKQGPAPEAHIIGVRLDPNMGYPCVVLVYDRPIEEPILTAEYGLEQKLEDADADMQARFIEADRELGERLAALHAKQQEAQP